MLPILTNLCTYRSDESGKPPARSTDAVNASIVIRTGLESIRDAVHALAYRGQARGCASIRGPTRECTAVYGAVAKS